MASYHSGIKVIKVLWVWTDVILEHLIEILMMIAFGFFVGLGEKIIEHLEQWYLMKKYLKQQEEKRKKRGKVAKRQRR